MDHISNEIEMSKQTEDRSTKEMAYICFEIPVNEDTKSCRKPPKRISQPSYQRQTLTVENLHKKQQLAEDRRKKRKAEKLARIHQRQEAAREMAKHVEKLLQQRALWQGGENDGTTVQKMSQKEIMETAKQVQLNFYKMRHEVCNDLNVEKTISKADKILAHQPELKENRLNDNRQGQEEAKCDRNSAKPKGGMAFTIDLEADKEKETKCKPLKTREKKTLSQDDLLYKQMQAEERRRKRLELRAQRTRENREAMLQLHSNLDKLLQLQNTAQQDDVDSSQAKAANKQAAKLAHQIADTFGNLADRYRTDLDRSEGFPTIGYNVS